MSRWAASQLAAMVLTAIALLCAVRLVTGWTPAPAPPLIDFRKSYLAGSLDGAPTHFLYPYGIFGFHRRLAEADVVLLGTSHIEFGIDPDRLAETLTARLGRPIRVFDAGLGYADGYAMARQIIERNDLHDKTIVLDLYDPFRGWLSTMAVTALGAGLLRAHVFVMEYSVDYLVEWLKDRLFPKLEWSGGSFAVRQWLSVYYSSRLATGRIDQDLAGVAQKAYPPVDDADPVSLNRPLDEEYCRARRLRCYVTLVPYLNKSAALPSVSLDNVARFVALNRLDYLPIAPDGLDFFDQGMHLAAASRTIATARLAEALVTVMTGPSRP